MLLYAFILLMLHSWLCFFIPRFFVNPLWASVFKVLVEGSGLAFLTLVIYYDLNPDMENRKDRRKFVGYLLFCYSFFIIIDLGAWLAMM